MLEELNAPNISLSLITLISLLVNAVTIYRWVSDYLKQRSLNNQAYQMLLGLAHSTNKRVTVIVRRMNILQQQDRVSDESMIFLENMWADARSTVDNLLAAAKALMPHQADKLPYDGDELLALSALKSNENTIKRNALHNNSSQGDAQKTRAPA